ncbi:hypoxanthine phosphoribosyltransferase [Clostridium sp. 'deep sea']|nr:hypoxanthine phosphoribosyltransferase [Clostridium sp. 'deep sea']
MDNSIKYVMYSEEQIKKRVSEIAAQISVDYQSKDVLLVCVLRGSIIFTADLIREISIPVKVDTIAVSSYGNSTESSGVVRLIKDLDETIKDVHVLIVEDIIDSGLTLQYLINMLKQRNPASVKVCTLLDKRERRMSNVIPDYAGFIIPNEFVIGYGMDYGEYYRQLPYIGVLKPEVYQ